MSTGGTPPVGLTPGDGNSVGMFSSDRIGGFGYGVGVSGWATGINLGKESKGVTYTGHRNIGIAVFALGTLQVINQEHSISSFPSIQHLSNCYQPCQNCRSL